MYRMNHKNNDSLNAFFTHTHGCSVYQRKVKNKWQKDNKKPGTKNFLPATPAAHKCQHTIKTKPKTDPTRHKHYHANPFARTSLILTTARPTVLPPAHTPPYLRSMAPHTAFIAAAEGALRWHHRPTTHIILKLLLKPKTSVLKSRSTIIGITKSLHISKH